MKETCESEVNKLTDPSANVIMFVGNAVKYLKDLQTANEKACSDRLDVYIEYAKQTAEAETNRINELRRVDVEAVKIANERAINQAAILASNVAQSAETLRLLVASTAENIAKTFSSTSEGITNRIAILEKAQSENVGKGSAPSITSQRLTDLEDKLTEKINNLETTKAENKGRAGISAPLLILITSAGVGLIIYFIQLLIKGA